jgi:ribosomal protein S18 acetylase RimI-like enzyme
MDIRFLTSEDAREWMRLRLEALENEPSAFSSSPEEHYALSLEEVKRRLGSPNGDSFVVGAFDEGSLLGMAGFQREKGPKRKHKGRIWGVYVTSSNRGAGLGRQILQRVLDRVKQIEGVEQVLLSVTSAQVPAMKLYRSLGFEQFGREPRALKLRGDYLDEDYMFLSVNAAQTAG